MTAWCLCLIRLWRVEHKYVIGFEWVEIILVLNVLFSPGHLPLVCYRNNVWSGGETRCSSSNGIWLRFSLEFHLLSFMTLTFSLMSSVLWVFFGSFATRTSQDDFQRVYMLKNFQHGLRLCFNSEASSSVVAGNLTALHWRGSFSCDRQNPKNEGCS